MYVSTWFCTLNIICMAFYESDYQLIPDTHSIHFATDFFLLRRSSCLFLAVLISQIQNAIPKFLRIPKINSKKIF